MHDIIEVPKLSELLAVTKTEQGKLLAKVNAHLESLTAQQRVLWAFNHLPGTHAVSSSFGIQSALMLHLVSNAKADVPVVLTDTGYLFPETYLFIDELTERLGLNLKIYKSELSPAWQEARFGKLWEQGIEGIDKYNRLNKIEPMQKALEQLSVGVWFSGLRREQSQSRARLPILAIQNGVFKFLPVIDWTNKDVHYYLKDNELPYHPLWERGYLSIGDTHTTRKWEPGMVEEDTRFFGLKRECGLHDTDLWQNDGAGI